MQRLFQTILKELGCSARQTLLPQHVDEELFTLMASSILKVPQLQSTRLFDKLKECLTETGEGLDKKNEQKSSQNQLLVKNLKLLVELYQFLPGKKAAGAG